MKTKKNLGVIGGGLLALLSMPAFAQSGLVLPMQYYVDPTAIDVPGVRVLPGAVTSTQNGVFSVKPAGKLWVAPTTMKMSASGFHRYDTANCSVVSNALEEEVQVSDLMNQHLDEIEEWKQLDSELRAEYAVALKACLEAIKVSAPNKDQLCEYKSAVAEAMKEIAEANTPWVEALETLATNVAGRLEKFGQEPGGFAAATVTLVDQDVLKKVQDANPNHQVAFVPMKDIVFSFTPSYEDMQTAQIPKRTTLGFALAGQSLPPNQMTGTPEATTAIRTGTNVAIGITLSRLGACQAELLRAGAFNYLFDSFAFVRGEAKVNDWASYERLEEASTENGFFTTKAVRKLYEEMKSKNSFDVAVEGVGETGKSLEELRTQFEAAVLQDIITRNANVAALATSPGHGLGLPTPPAQNGASVIGDGLSKFPHIYAIGSGFVLKGLSAIFGGTSTRDEAKRVYNKEYTRSFGYNTTVPAFDSAAGLIQWDFEPQPEE